MTDALELVSPEPDRGLQRIRTGARYRGFDAARTPREIFETLDVEFDFELDVAADESNALCRRFFAIADDGLAQRWAPARCWCNPPYSQIERWTAKAVVEARAGALVVALLPVRSSVEWFHEHVLEVGAEIRFVRKRVHFLDPRRPRRGGGSAPFDSMVVVWRPEVVS